MGVGRGELTGWWCFVRTPKYKGCSLGSAMEEHHAEEYAQARVPKQEEPDVFMDPSFPSLKFYVVSGTSLPHNMACESSSSPLFIGPIFASRLWYSPTTSPLFPSLP